MSAAFEFGWSFFILRLITWQLRLCLFTSSIRKFCTWFIFRFCRLGRALKLTSSYVVSRPVNNFQVQKSGKKVLTLCLFLDIGEKVMMLDRSWTVGNYIGANSREWISQVVTFVTVDSRTLRCLFYWCFSGQKFCQLKRNICTSLCSVN